MPLYYLEEDEFGLISQTTAVLDATQERTGVRLSMHSRALILNAFTAVVEDPSPMWQVSDEERRRQALKLMERLPEFVAQLSLNAEKRVTFFDTLHWLTSHLDSICPFKKSPAGSFERGRE